MSEQKNETDESEMKGHSYDGITECDNPLPAWWLWTFLFTIMFSVLYYIHYEVAGGPTLKEELTTALADIEKQKSHAPVSLETEESLQQEMNAEGVLARGATTFAAKCAVCHGAELQGQIGPNLVDASWIHGRGTRMDIVNIVRDGVPDKGMPSWKQLLNKQEVYAVTALIVSKKGSQPPHPKPPQGQVVQ